jgi:colanic acid/amylovoran biosynthesis protein
VIFALTARVPCIAIGYEHKTHGIMRDLSLNGWVLPAWGLSAARLYGLFGKLEKHRSDYQAHLDHVIPIYVERGHAITDALGRAYYGGPVTAEREDSVGPIGYEEDCHICRESIAA